jgi:hypothetical protein
MATTFPNKKKYSMWGNGICFIHAEGTILPFTFFSPFSFFIIFSSDKSRPSIDRDYIPFELYASTMPAHIHGAVELRNVVPKSLVRISTQVLTIPGASCSLSASTSQYGESTFETVSFLEVTPCDSCKNRRFGRNVALPSSG